MCDLGAAMSDRVEYKVGSLIRWKDPVAGNAGKAYGIIIDVDSEVDLPLLVLWLDWWKTMRYEGTEDPMELVSQ